MTRVLSELLGAPEHRLKQGLQQLELAHGRPSADVKLTADLTQATQAKIRELGLDPHDTTGHELYAVLRQRLETDDANLTSALQKAAGTDDLIVAISHALKTADLPRTCFALKSAVLKTLLKKTPPKQTMKQLGYRSLDSLLKREQLSAVLAAAWLLEPATWRRGFYDGYKKLRSSDFESRDIIIATPNSVRWQKLSAKLITKHRHTVVALKELGALVLLPLPADKPPVVVTAVLTLALHSLNEIRAASTFLRLCQVRRDFGKVVQEVVADEPKLSVELLDQHVSWQLVQRYYARFKDSVSSELFEPHLQADDLSWHDVEAVINHFESGFSFWQDTQALGLLDAGQVVSLNLADVALAACNQLPYEQRIVHYFRSSVWHELLLKYLKHEQVEGLVLGQLQPELATEPALI